MTVIIVREFKCKLCERTFYGVNRHDAGVGHFLSQGGYCCDECNFTKVLPARMRGEHL